MKIKNNKFKIIYYIAIKCFLFLILFCLIKYIKIFKLNLNYKNI